MYSMQAFLFSLSSLNLKGFYAIGLQRQKPRPFQRKAFQFYEYSLPLCLPDHKYFLLREIGFQLKCSLLTSISIIIDTRYFERVVNTSPLVSNSMDCVPVKWFNNTSMRSIGNQVVHQSSNTSTQWLGKWPLERKLSAESFKVSFIPYLVHTNLTQRPNYGS